MCQQLLKRLYHSKSANVRLNLEDSKTQDLVNVIAFPRCQFYWCPCAKSYSVSSLKVSLRRFFFFLIEDL